jgi:hypothetical protein
VPGSASFARNSASRGATVSPLKPEPSIAAPSR